MNKMFGGPVGLGTSTTMEAATRAGTYAEAVSLDKGMCLQIMWQRPRSDLSGSQKLNTKRQFMAILRAV